MSRSRKEDKTKKQRGNLSQFGLFDIPDIDSFNYQQDDIDDDDDDEALEAELNMIMAASTNAPLRPQRKAPARPTAQGRGPNLDAMIAASLKDVPSDDSGAEDGDDDDDDPNLLAELRGLTSDSEPPLFESEPLSGVAKVVPAEGARAETAGTEGEQVTDDTLSLLRERIGMYTQAEQLAKQTNDSSKARRLKRGLDQLKVLLKRAEAGVVIQAEDIPVPVAIGKTETERSEQETQHNKDEILSILTARRDQYKMAALTAKKSNNIDTALSYIKIVKQFEVVLEAVERGQPFDLSTMPPPPSQAPVDLSTVSSSPAPPPVDLTTGSSLSPPPQRPPAAITPTPSDTSQSASQGGEVVTVLEALESRLAKYMEQEESAKRDGNLGKVRRMGRIVKQYKDAISLHSRGKPIPVDELPTPPGFPPIPVPGGGASGLPSLVSPHPVDADATEPRQGSTTTVPAGGGGLPSPHPVDSTRQQQGGTITVPGGASGLPSPGTSPTPPTSLSPEMEDESRTSTSLPSPQPPSAPSSIGGTQTRHERQIAVLLLRQRDYKVAALKAKQANDLVKAKEYLKLAKGFDSIIDAARSGLPIDMDTLPRPLNKKSPELDTFEIVRIDDCIEGTDSEIYDKLITDLKNQLKMCVETLNHFKAMGDIANANRFENLASNTKRDYTTVRSAHMTCSHVPKFHYENRSFSIVRCNVDLTDGDLEMNIIQGVNYNVPNPKEIDTYVKYEFPYPNDEIKSEKTSTVYNTNNPEYKAVFIIPIQRNSRPFQRVIRRHSVKLHVWSKGGFLRSDQLVATAQIKLQPLETKCTIHDAFDLMDGRKPLGGKLEVKLRLRNPMVSKQIEQIKEKWLVID